MSQLKVLIADDEVEIRKYVRHVFEKFLKISASIHEAADGEHVVQLCQQESYDLILLDVKMPKMSGLEALAAIQASTLNTHIIVMTAHGNVKDAVLAIKDGAYDYIEKPLDQELVVKIIRQAIEAKDLLKQVALSHPVLESDADSNLIGPSEAMQNVFQLIRKFSHLDSTVLLRGENGTGKELVARAIHLNSPRNSHPFVAINCAAIPAELIESELFGHEKGAFTGADERKIGKFQMASQGTLFLDEIGELQYEMQSKLLRVLQEKTFMPVGSNRVQQTHARIVAATNQNLEKMMLEQRFREDLFFRLNVMPVYLPPLRDRMEDIPFLVSHFVEKYTEPGTQIPIDPQAMQKLEDYSWPGNIRQLENCVQRAALFLEGGRITLASLSPEILGFEKEAKDTLDFERFKVESEKEFIVKALTANKGKINRTVANANIPKNTLLRKIKKYAIDVKSLTKSQGSE